MRRGAVALPSLFALVLSSACGDLRTGSNDLRRDGAIEDGGGDAARVEDASSGSDGADAAERPDGPREDAGSLADAGDVVEPDACAVDHGGCDPRTSCSAHGSDVTCGPCPRGSEDIHGDGTACVCAAQRGGRDCAMACPAGELLTSVTVASGSRPAYWLCAGTVVSRGRLSARGFELRGEIARSPAGPGRATGSGYTLSGR